MSRSISLDISAADEEVVLGLDEGEIEDTTVTEIEFAIPYEPGTLEGVSNAIRAEVRDAEGELLFVSDTSTTGVEDGEPVEDLEVAVVDAETAGADVVVEIEVEVGDPEESPTA